MKKTGLLALLFYYCAITIAQNPPQYVEPPFWWAGMHHHELQIMVYEKGIGKTNVVINHDGIRLKEVVKVENPNYVFIYLDLSEATPTTFEIGFYDGEKLEFAYQYELRQRQENSQNRKGFDASDAIYLLMPDRFANGDPNNDFVEGMLEGTDLNDPDARQGGDIQGIINHLDYIANMGFTAIWINPLLENNQPKYSYHGYAITDFYNIDPRFGTNEDYVRLVQEAEKRGMKVIKDMIFNHCGHKHWWMDDLPTSDWINTWPEFTRTSYRMTTLVDPHVAQSDYDIMTKGWFDTNMPDLNQHQRLLATYLIQNSVWWIEYSGILGIRMDTQPFAELDFMADWGRFVAAEYPYFRIVGEAWVGIPAMVSYYQAGKNNDDGYDSNIPSLFDFPLYDAIRDGFNEEPGWNNGVMRLYNMLAQDYLYPDPYNLVVFADNHDITRIFTSLQEDVAKLKMALTFIFTIRGIPMMYYGTELLMAGYEHLGHGKKRKRFPGGWPGDEHNAFLPEGRTSEQNEVVNHIISLLNIRKNEPLLHYGKLKHFVPDDNVYVYFRYDDASAVMVVINSNDETKALNNQRFNEITSDYQQATDLLNDQVLNLRENWNLPAKSALVLKLSK